MPQRLAKTKTHRAKKTKKLGASGKRARENKGTTPTLPLSGPLPSLKRGKVVSADSIKVPTSLLK